jgi:hypothetical protein
MIYGNGWPSSRVLVSPVQVWKLFHRKFILHHVGDVSDQTCLHQHSDGQAAVYGCTMHLLTLAEVGQLIKHPNLAPRPARQLVSASNHSQGIMDMHVAHL